MALKDSHDRKSERRERKNSDLLTRIIVWCGVFGWLTMLAVIAVLNRAKPESSQFIPDRSMFQQAGVPYYLRTSWDQDLVGYILYLLILGFILGVVGLVLNARRHRRPGDFYRIHLMLLSFLSAGGIIYSIFF